MTERSATHQGMHRLLIPLLLMGCSDQLGTLDLSYSGTVDGQLSASSGDISGSPGTNEDMAVWPYIGDIGANDDQLRVVLPRFVLGTHVASTAELTVDGARFNTNAGGSVTVTTTRVRWNNNSSFPFVHEGTLAGTIEGLELDGDFTISEDSCNNTVINTDNSGCGGAWLGLDEDSFEVSILGWRVDSCPDEVRDLYIDGSTLDVTRRSVQMGGAQKLDCVDTRRGGGEHTSGDISFEGGPYQCGHDTSLEIDGCTWNVTALSSSERWLGVTAAVVDEACEELVCSIEVGDFSVGQAGG